MTQEFRQYLSRLRKAQDAILNHKNSSEKKASLGVTASTSRSTGEPTISVCAHLHEDVDCIASEYAQIWPWHTAEEIEKELAAVSKLIGFTI